MSTERLLDVAESTVKLVMREGVDQAHATSFLQDSALTRYANSQIHQNVATKKGGVAIKAVVDKKTGIIRIDTLKETQIKGAIKQVVKIAKVTPPNKDFKSLPKPEKWTPIQHAFDKETAVCTPDYRAERVKELIDAAHSMAPIVKAVAGSFSTGILSFAVSNSLGVSACTKISLASMKATVISETEGSEGFGTAEEYSKRVKDIKPLEIADKAAQKSVESVKPTKVSPGEYEVVLSPLAVGTLLFYLGYIGFSATPYQDGQSFVKYHLNEQVFDGKLSVKDDALDPNSLLAIPVDDEGVPKRVVQLIDEGVVSEQSICYDSFTAGKETDKQSTGHSVPPIALMYPFPLPLPINIVANPGDSSIEEMIEDTKRGIFVTRFNYVNPVEPTRAILTGLTRDGTFLIEKGEIDKPIMNLRFTDSMLSALNKIPLTGKELKMLQVTTVPAMKLKKLRFTGITKY
jgi:predicted Zn-dependent protease